MPRSLLIVSVAVALSLLGDQMFYVVLPVMHDAVGVPVVSLGVLLSANRWVRLLTNALAALVVARWGRLWPFVLALLLGGLTTMAYGVIYGVWVFLVVRLLWGTAWSFIRLEGLSTALDVASDQTRGRFLGLYQAISRLGGAVAMLAGGILHDLMGFRATFIVFGGLTCLGACLVHYERTRRQSGHTAQPLAGSRPAPGVSLVLPSEQAEPVATDGATRWRMAVASLSTFSNFLVGALVSATLGYMLRRRFGTSLTVGVWAIGVASVTGCLLSSKGFLDLGFAPVAGRLADRWGRTRMVFGALSVAIIAVGVLALQPPLGIVVSAVVVMYTATTALHVTLDAVASDLVSAGKRRAFLSLFVTWQDLGAAAGPLIGYWIAPQFGLVGLYLCGAGLLLLTAGVYLTTCVGYTPQLPAKSAV